MERIDAEVRRELGRFGPHEGETHSDAIVAVVRSWPRAVGDTIAGNAWPARIGRDGTLHVSTVSATWAFELGRLAPAILAQLNAALDAAAAPKALKFAPGAVPEAAGGPAEEGTPRAPAPSVEQRAEADALAAGIEDVELRGLVARAAAASLAGGRPGTTDDRRF